MAQVIKKATRESFGMALCELAKIRIPSVQIANKA